MPRRKRNRSSQREPAARSLAVRLWLSAPLGLLLILLATFLVYLPALHGAVLWDDDANITRPELQSVNGLYRIWVDPTSTAQYYPLLHTVFWLEHKLWGDAVLGYHVVNVLWHVVTVLLLYRVLTKLKIPGTLLAAAIFALHPVMVESVAWITEQKNVLSAVFYLGAVLAYLEFDQSRGRLHYLLALGLFVLALLIKTSTVTLPPALLVIFWWQRGTLSLKRDIWPLVPFFALAAAAGLTTTWVEQKYYGSEGATFELTLLERFLLAGRSMWFYLSKLAWPVNLIFFYPRWTIDAAQASQWIYTIAVLAVTTALWAARKWSRAPLAGWLYFCGTLLPVLGFLNVYYFTYSFVADHFQYLASLGIIVLSAAGIALGLQRLQQPARRVGEALCTVFLATLAALTWQQSHMYADRITLYQATLDRNPKCWLAHNNLGTALAEIGQHQDAMAHYRTAIRLKPDRADAHNNLGNSLVSIGRLNDAIDEFNTALKLRPDYPATRNNLGVTLMNAGRLPEAVEQLQAALTLRPNDPVAMNNLGIAYTQMGRFAEAQASLERSLQLQPNRADLHNSLGDALRQSNQSQQAVEQYQAAIRLKPNFVQAYANLALAFELLNQPEAAIATARRAIQVARSNGQEAAAQQLEEWLGHYQAELRRHAEVAPASQSPSHPTDKSDSQ